MPRPCRLFVSEARFGPAWIPAITGMTKEGVAVCAVRTIISAPAGMMVGATTARVVVQWTPADGTARALAYLPYFSQ